MPPAVSLCLDGAGHPQLWAGVARARLARRWYRLTAEFGLDGAELTVTPLDPCADDEPARAVDPEPVVLAVPSRPGRNSGVFDGGVPRVSTARLLPECTGGARCSL